MDGQGSIAVKAPKNFSVEAGENINMNASHNMNTTVGINKTDIIGGNHSENITGSKFITIGIDFMTKVMGNFGEFIKGKRDSESTERKEIAKTVSLSSTEEYISVHASKYLKKFSGEGTVNS